MLPYSASTVFFGAALMIMGLTSELSGQARIDLPTDSTFRPPLPAQPEEYVKIQPPLSTDLYLSQCHSLSEFLGNLPVQQALVHDTSERLLNAIATRFGPATLDLWRALELPDPLATGERTLASLLGVIHFRSFDQSACRELLRRWDGEMSPREKEALKRLYLVLIATKIAYGCAAVSASDAVEGLYDVIDLVLGAARLAQGVGRVAGGIVLEADLGRKLRSLIIQRLLLALDSLVNLATAPLAEPGRSKARAIAGALVGIYCHAAQMTPVPGLGGDPSISALRVVFGVLGKGLLLTSPGVGFVQRSEAALERAVSMATAMEVTGTYKQATERILDDRIEGSGHDLVERISQRTLKVSRRSRTRRFAAVVAGALSQVALLLGLVDPTSASRVVALVSGLLAAGLQTYAVFDSFHLYLCLPGEVDRAVEQAFHPDHHMAATTDRPSAPVSSPLEIADTASILSAQENFAEAIDLLQDTAREGDSGRVIPGIDRLRELGRVFEDRLRRDAASRPALADSVFEHHARMAAAEEMAILEASRSGTSGLPMESLLEALEDLDEATRRAMSDHMVGDATPDSLATSSAGALAASSLLAPGAILSRVTGTSVTPADRFPAVPSNTAQEDPPLTLSCPAAVEGTGNLSIGATIRNNRAEPISRVTLRMVVPEGFQPVTSPVQAVDRIEGGTEVPIEWGVTGGPPASGPTGFLVLLEREGELIASRFIYLME